MITRISFVIFIILIISNSKVIYSFYWHEHVHVQEATKNNLKDCSIIPRKNTYHPSFALYKSRSYLWTRCSFSLSILCHLRFKAFYLVNYCTLLYKRNTLQIQVNYFPIASQTLDVKMTFFSRYSDKCDEYFRFCNSIGTPPPLPLRLIIWHPSPLRCDEYFRFCNWREIGMPFVLRNSREVNTVGTLTFKLLSGSFFLDLFSAFFSLSITKQKQYIFRLEWRRSNL